MYKGQGKIQEFFFFEGGKGGVLSSLPLSLKRAICKDGWWWWWVGGAGSAPGANIHQRIQVGEGINIDFEHPTLGKCPS